MSEPQATSSLQPSSLVTCEPPSNTWHTVLIQRKHRNSIQDALNMQGFRSSFVPPWLFVPRRKNGPVLTTIGM